MSASKPSTSTSTPPTSDLSARRASGGPGPTPCVLIACEGARELRATARRRFPGLAFAACDDPNALPGLLEARPFQAAYTSASSPFPRQALAEIAERPPEGLAWVHVGGSGWDHLAGLNFDKNILTNGRGVLAPFLADTAMAALLALNQNVPAWIADKAERAWKPRTFPPLAGKLLLVVGAGAIGTELARRAAPFGLRVVGLARSARTNPSFEAIEPLGRLHAWLGRADFVSIHLPLHERTRGLFDASKIRAMKPGAALLDAARGGIVDEAALDRALRSGRLAGAWLDVFEQEPLPPGHALWDTPNLLISAHCSDQAADWRLRHFAFFLDNLERWLKGRALANRVARPT